MFRLSSVRVSSTVSASIDYPLCVLYLYMCFFVWFGFQNGLFQNHLFHHFVMEGDAPVPIKSFAKSQGVLNLQRILTL